MFVGGDDLLRRARCLSEHGFISCICRSRAMGKSRAKISRANRTAWRTSSLMLRLWFDKSSSLWCAVTEAQLRERHCVRKRGLVYSQYKNRLRQVLLEHFSKKVDLFRFLKKNSKHFADLQGRRNLCPYHPVTPGGDRYATQRAHPLMCERTDWGWEVRGRVLDFCGSLVRDNTPRAAQVNS